MNALFWAGFEKRAFATKRSYKTLDFHKLDPNDASQAWTAKIDGAHSYAILNKGETPQLFSHRTSKRNGLPIPYTPKLLHLNSASSVNARLRTEVFAVDRKGRAVEPEVVTAMLNSNVDNSLALQKRLGLKTRTALIDIDSIEGKDATHMPFGEKRKLMEQIVKDNPDFTLPAIATTPKAKEKLRARILAGTHPQTKEGLVVHELAGSTFSKAKIVNEHDIVVRDIFNEEGTKPGRPAGMAGGFHYSWTENGPIVGRVGTGFSHDLKRQMATNPGDFIGRVARVKALGVSKNDVLMKPSFSHWHVERNIQ